MVGVPQQLRLAAVEAPTAARRLRARSGAWFAAYVLASAAVLAGVAYLVIAHKEGLIQAAMAYVLPSDWQVASKLLLDRLFGQQEEAVVTNAAIALSLLAVQVTLFPLKEQVSAALEADARLVDEPVAEHPLWLQAWEEVKLAAMMIAAQGTIFWIGYTDDPLRTRVALVLSYVVLFASVGIDFLSPVLQRHKLLYSSILKTLAAHPVLTFGFGAVFALPAIVAARLTADHPTWGLSAQLGASFAAQVAGVALAAIGGTVAGAALLRDARRRRRSHAAVRALAWIVLLGLLAGNAYRFGAVGRSLHHKSQILKCRYDVDWGSLDVERPGVLDLAAAAKTDRLTVRVSLAMTITNPTDVDVEIEDNRLEARQAGQLVAQTALPRLRVPAGGRERVTLALPVTVRPSQALRLRELITTDGWTLTLYLQVARGFEFPVYLLAR